MMVVTCTEISAGEELCVRYIDTRGTFSYRQYMLQANGKTSMWQTVLRCFKGDRWRRFEPCAMCPCSFASFVRVQHLRIFLKCLGD